MNMKRLSFGGAAAAVVLAGTLVWTASAQNTVDEVLRVAFIGGPTSSTNQRDNLLYQAAVLAAEQINDDGGVAGPDDTRYGFEIVYYEAATQAEVLSALDDAVADDAIAVLGPNDPTLAQAISDRGAEIPVLLGASAAPEGSLIYRLSANYATWAEAAANYLTQQRQLDSIGVLTVNTDNALSAHDAFVAATGTDSIVADITFDEDRTDFSAEAAAIRDAGAEAVFLWARSAQSDAVLQALQDVNWEGVVVTGGNDGAFLSAADVDTQDIFGLANWTTAAYDTESQAFVADYTDRWESAPGNDTAAYYDAVDLVAAAVVANGADATSMASWLTNTGELDGVQGRYERAQTDSVRLLQWRDGEPVEVARFADGACQNCAAIYAADITDEAVENSATFRLGLITSGSDNLEAQRTSLEDSINLAIREINDQGGVIAPDNTRYTFALDVYTADTAEEASAALQQAAEDGVQVVLGPDLNGQVFTNLTDAESSAIVQLVSAANGQITQDESGDYVFQMRATDETLAWAAADYLLENRELTRLVTVASNTDYGISAINAFTEVVNQSDDGDILLALEHDIVDTDMTGLAEQIARANPEAVAVWTTQPAASALLSALNALGWEGVFQYGYLTPEFVAENPSGAIELIGPVAWWSTAEAWASQDFSARFASRYGEEPTPQSAAYYDAVYLVQTAIRDAGADAADIRAWLLDQPSFVGVQGEYTPERFSNGELSRSVILVGVENGAVRELSRYSDGVCIAQCAG